MGDDQQFRVHWSDRAAYLLVLKELKEAVTREMDLVQVGAYGSRRLTEAMEAVHIAKVRYYQQCQDNSLTRPAEIPVETLAKARKSPSPKRS